MIKIMKRTATIMVSVGLVLFASACTTDSASDKQDNATPLVEKSYSVDAEKVNKITLSDQGRKVELVKSEDNEIHITYFENDKESYDINVSDENELVMKAVTNKQWKDYIGLDLDKSNRYVQIAVPNGIHSGVEITTSKGDIVVSDLDIDGSVDATTSDGTIELTNVEIGNALNLKTKNDDMMLSGVSVKGSVNGTVSNGELKVEKVAFDGAMKLTTKNGDITGTIIGSYDDFRISSEASKGKSNLPESKGGGAKPLDVSTNNGDINLEFVK